ncbi:MAG TPA: hypothetical protein DCZ94_01525 [Lentisphaeria bacterium]|nr:MAG: hypothetical protein A2X48_21410 [Lentisphaerae bacterium GWF2_49_21]HBC85611.1 hypothetical protein [Lentisphaeria bacterium]
MKLIISALISAFVLVSVHNAGAGTITFKEKDGSTTSINNAEIVSIKDGTILIEKDKKRRSFPLSSIALYSPTDSSSAGGEKSIPGEFSDIKATIMEVKSPDKGVDKDGKTSVFELEYTMSRTTPEIKKIKAPYIYLYVLLPASDDSGEREVLRFCHPDAAKPKGKGYDEAAILEKIKGFDRKIWDEGEREHNLKKELKNMGNEVIKFELKSVKSRKIIAYHLEIWGNEAIVAERDWKDFDSNVAKKWWEKY